MWVFPVVITEVPMYLNVKPGEVKAAVPEFEVLVNIKEYAPPSFKFDKVIAVVVALVYAKLLCKKSIVELDPALKVAVFVAAPLT